MTASNLSGTTGIKTITMLLSGCLYSFFVAIVAMAPVSGPLQVGLWWVSLQQSAEQLVSDCWQVVSNWEHEIL